VSLVSAVGVQEMELFGQYELNHLIHGAQLGVLWAAHEAIPHFGLLDRAMLDVPYARTFFDSDQRPLRGALERLTPPTLIVHGLHDALVPVAAARESARLVPQSVLTVLDTDHFFIFREPERAAGLVAAFLDRADDGRAPRREDATPDRVQAAATPFDPRSVPRPGPVARVVLVLLLALATFFSEDLACIGAGAMVARGQLGFAAASLGCALGIMVGDLALFVFGRLAGRGLVGHWPLAPAITNETLERSAAWLRRHGAPVIIVSRFLPGTRVLTYVCAGVLRYPTTAFVRALAPAVALWTPLLVGLSSLATTVGLRWLGRDQLTGAGLAALVVLGGVRVGRQVATHEGRRRAVSLWLRLVRWEFWPSWVFYAPLVPRLLWLAVRHRSVTVFTAANPTLPAGGFIGESKIDILQGLADGGAPVAQFVALRSDESSASRVTRVRNFANEHGLPLVLKPDQGQRGTGVRIVRNQTTLLREVADLRSATILQAYVPGLEFGLFYVRDPRTDAGSLWSITIKELPRVTGDGVRTLRQLILDDSRAVALARVYERLNAEHLDRVPSCGERVRIAELGTHCRGAIFRDGQWLRTAALEHAVDRAARAVPGFAFGRFDVRASSIEALRSGDFSILELNGVTSEPTHIYDPRRSVMQAWHTVAQAWTLAFAIGAAQAANGVPVWGLRELWQLLIRYWRFARMSAATGARFDESPSLAGTSHVPSVDVM
jgi:membrane protein DedA with SNARE-associated domain